MSTAYKCDRCGAFYDNHVLRFHFDDDTYFGLLLSEGCSVSKPVDLCPDCLKAFDDFINNRTSDPEREGNAE